MHPIILGLTCETEYLQRPFTQIFIEFDAILTLKMLQHNSEFYINLKHGRTDISQSIFCNFFYSLLHNLLRLPKI